MSEVQRITVLWPVGPHGYGNYPVVLSSEYDKVQSELAALREDLLRLEEEYDTLEHANVTLKLKLAAAEQRNVSLLETARSLTIQLHATIGNTELHEDCVRDLAALEAVDAKG